MGESQCSLIGEKSEGPKIPWRGITGKALRFAGKRVGECLEAEGKDLWRGPSVEVGQGLVCLEKSELQSGGG